MKIDTMTMRDQFAAMALLGILAKEGCGSDNITQQMLGSDLVRDATMFAVTDAERAYIYADAMMAVRQWKEKP